MDLHDAENIGVRFTLDVPTASGVSTIVVTAEQIERCYDPMELAAAHFGLTTSQYQQWVTLEGAVLCAGFTHEGKPCRRGVGPSQQNAQTWLANQGRRYCADHS